MRTGIEIRLWEETLRDLKRRRHLWAGEREGGGATAEEVEGRDGVSLDFGGFAFDLGGGFG